MSRKPITKLTFECEGASITWNLPADLTAAFARLQDAKTEEMFAGALAGLLDGSVKNLERVLRVIAFGMFAGSASVDTMAAELSNAIRAVGLKAHTRMAAHRRALPPKVDRA